MPQQVLGIREVLKKLGYIVEGHFRLGGRLYDECLCARDFLKKEGLLLRPSQLVQFGKLLAGEIPLELCQPEPPVFIGVDRGGQYLAPFVAYHLGLRIGNPDAMVCLTVHREGDDFMIDPREQEYLSRFTRAIVVEDILALGRKVHRAGELAAQLDVRVVGLVALAQRGEVEHEGLRSIPIFSALRLSTAEPMEQCTLCRSGKVAVQAPEELYPEET